MTVQVLYPYNTSWDEEEVDYNNDSEQEQEEAITQHISQRVSIASSYDTEVAQAELLEQELTNLVTVTTTQTLRGPEFRRLVHEGLDEDNEEPETFNYIAGITNMEVLEEKRRRDNEFFNKDDMLREINQRLEAICTEANIDSEVRRVWSLNPKLLNRKRITPAERIAAIQQIKQDNRVEVRLRVTQIREMAMIEKYGAPNYQAPDQDLFF